MKSIFFMLLTVIGIPLYAQQQYTLYLFQTPAYRILANKKEVLKIGATLRPGDEIEFNQKTNVTLVCEEHFLPYTFRNVKRISVNTLIDTCTNHRQSFTSSYFHYVIDELKHGKGHAGDRFAHMKNIAGVKRNNTDIRLYAQYDSLIRLIRYKSGSFPVAISRTIPNEQLHLKVYSDSVASNLLLDILIIRPEFDLRDLKQRLPDHGTYYWEVAGNNTIYTLLNKLEIVSEEQQQAMLKRLDHVNIADDAELLFLIGYLLEDQHYFPLAYEYYKAAAAKAPSNEMYASVLQDFIKRYRL